MLLYDSPLVPKLSARCMAVSRRLSTSNSATHFSLERKESCLSKFEMWRRSTCTTSREEAKYLLVFRKWIRNQNSMEGILSQMTTFLRFAYFLRMASSLAFSAGLALATSASKTHTRPRLGLPTHVPPVSEYPQLTAR